MKKKEELSWTEKYLEAERRAEEETDRMINRSRIRNKLMLLHWKKKGKKQCPGERIIICSNNSEKSRREDRHKGIFVFPTECVSGNKYIRIGSETWYNPVWITEDYHNMNIPRGLIWMIDHWKEEAASDFKSFKQEYFEKNAKLRFIWFDEFYVLPYHVLGTTQEHFSCFANKIIKELREMGCPYTRYDGEMD